MRQRLVVSVSYRKISTYPEMIMVIHTRNPKYMIGKVDLIIEFHTVSCYNFYRYILWEFFL